MFQVTPPPEADSVRVLAANGKAGKPPCIWQGPATIDPEIIEDTIAREPHVQHWLVRNSFIKDGAATLNLQVECFSQEYLVKTLHVRSLTSHRLIQ